MLLVADLPEAIDMFLGEKLSLLQRINRPMTLMLFVRTKGEVLKRLTNTRTVSISSLQSLIFASSTSLTVRAMAVQPEPVDGGLVTTV